MTPVPHVATCAPCRKTREQKNALCDSAGMARAVVRSYVGTGRNACATGRQGLAVAMRENVGGVGLTSVGARNAVPGERTWRNRPIRRDVGLPGLCTAGLRPAFLNCDGA